MSAGGERQILGILPRLAHPMTPENDAFGELLAAAPGRDHRMSKTTKPAQSI
jgi:hypothetical protein